VARPANQITLLAVYRAVEEAMAGSLAKTTWADVVRRVKAGT
jgi:DNA-binding IscR family transcriptional regulator